MCRRAAWSDGSAGCPWWPQQPGQAPGSQSERCWLVTVAACAKWPFPLYRISRCRVILLGGSERSPLDTSINLVRKVCGQATASWSALDFRTRKLPSTTVPWSVSCSTNREGTEQLGTGRRPGWGCSHWAVLARTRLDSSRHLLGSPALPLHLLAWPREGPWAWRLGWPRGLVPL